LALEKAPQVPWKIARTREMNFCGSARISGLTDPGAVKKKKGRKKKKEKEEEENSKNLARTARKGPAPETRDLGRLVRWQGAA
jgi:hypothetical protein